MHLKIHREVPLNVITSNGKWETATTSSFNGFLRHIIVKADSDSTDFNFRMMDDNQIDIYSRESVNGELNEQVCIPLKGKYSLYISDATADESFTVYLGVQES